MPKKSLAQAYGTSASTMVWIIRKAFRTLLASMLMGTRENPKPQRYYPTLADLLAPALRSACHPCCSRRPIRNRQPRHALELAAVRRHQGRARPARLSGDEHIVRSDGRAEPSQVGADVRRLLCVRLLERRNIEAACRHEQGDLLLVLAPALAGGRPVHQLVIDDDRQGERRMRRPRLVEACAHRRRTVVEERDGGIGVEMDHRSNTTRSFGRAGWSRPSGMKGESPVSSMIAHGIAADGSSGSRITRSPTLVTRTSEPSKRNSLGSRAAWLRPCLNTFAVALMRALLEW